LLTIRSQPDAADGPIVDNTYKKSMPDGEVVVDNAKRGRRRRWM
jgi:hypothetical protein